MLGNMQRAAAKRSGENFLHILLGSRQLFAMSWNVYHVRATSMYGISLSALVIGPQSCDVATHGLRGKKMRNSMAFGSGEILDLIIGMNGLV